MQRSPWLALLVLLLAACASAPPPRPPPVDPPAAGAGRGLQPAVTQTATDGAPPPGFDPSRVVYPEPRFEPRARYGNHSPYRVFGQSYRVLDSAKGYRERGLASWYGTKFHGRPTSTMEPYDLYQLTAAHKTLPLPSYARVTNLDNGRSLVVRINDRGPFKPGRIIDLSYAAAVLLGVYRTGTAPVEVRSIVVDEQGRWHESGGTRQRRGAGRTDAPRPAKTPAAGSEIAQVDRPPVVESSPTVAAPAAARLPSAEPTPLAADAPTDVLAEPVTAVPVPTALPAEAIELSAAGIDAELQADSETLYRRYLQVASFAAEAPAIAIAQTLRAASIAGVEIDGAPTIDGIRFRVRIGPLGSDPEIADLQRLLQTLGHPNSLLILE